MQQKVLIDQITIDEREVSAAESGDNVKLKIKGAEEEVSFFC
jgi:hypothetical protein